MAKNKAIKKRRYNLMTHYWAVSTMEQLSNGVTLHPVLMKKNELTPKQVSSVPCPTCGVAIRKSCVLHSGAPRSSPHVDRRFAAIEAIERKSG
jgi:hypothetical protein